MSDYEIHQESDKKVDSQNSAHTSKPTDRRPIQDRVLSGIIHVAEYFGLLVIAIATIFAGMTEVYQMALAGEVTLGDLLLLFLYLEVLAMVGIYLKSGKLPIRFPIYIAIVALARLLILDLKSLTEWEMIAIAGTITLLSFAVLVLRYGHIQFPYVMNRKKDD
ncbi:phosphate-starvation-inducible protein PsiE [Thiomicrorhabdus xiamenensis]|uniref:Protein PsiE n=1 Tax=Thiomicrorhabdus xiamenensis TaxID=2739063 RepID=A0A7D4P5N5_9GAMM|nr:phosphate-starvation-inducible PsiE family protein [Thiomicrorhabdus xiamenensis]QKI90016.1 phosphate-starvation-inducible PsiE family protein [Thiomicrorhabdus xiamenensis]